MKEEIKKFLVIAGVFFFVYYMPLESMHFKGAVIESLYMLQDYARHHVLTCLIPALFIAGAISNFISQ
ncbi:permease, partial [Thermoanaerobacter sp. CM-CNRG TB177]